MERPKRISKLISVNDAGANGSHQAGVLVPKNKQILSFFPELDEGAKNPRASLAFTDEAGKTWVFSFIHYNNKLFGGTRNEYRLTGMTRFMREVGAKPGDTLFFERKGFGEYSISIVRAQDDITSVQDGDATHVRLVVSDSWRVVSI